MNLYTSFLLSLYLSSVQFGAANALAHRSQHFLAEEGAPNPSGDAFTNTSSAPPKNESDISNAFNYLVSALDVMQNSYFELWQGIWPTSIDWTAAVLGTHVSATLSSLTSSMGNDSMCLMMDSDADDNGEDDDSDDHQTLSAIGRIRKNSMTFENLVNHFFAHTSAFYFGENAFALRNQAYDDMLWVVLGWLENIKFQVLHSDLHYGPSHSGQNETTAWHGTQFRAPAAHRARLFYGLASGGWDVSLCNGGMIWNPNLIPYKNAITNELYIAASIGMYLYFPGDVIDSPFVAQSDSPSDKYPHNPVHLQAAVEGYRWLKNSNMMGGGGLYGDGFHISGWKSVQQPGTRRCDALNTMVYTYNQGVILSGLRGLWLATGSNEYLHDGHELVQKILRATGWPDTSSNIWADLGRGGVLEDTCDAAGSCSQDGQTFKSIFFHHFTEFCRPLQPQEERFLGRNARDWASIYRRHQALCRDYGPWVEHNAQAALKTRNGYGQFGMWWGQVYGMQAVAMDSPLPAGANDYRNSGQQGDDSEELIGAQRNLKPTDGAEDVRTRASDWGHNGDNGQWPPLDSNSRGRGRTVETQAGGVAVLRALYEWRRL